MPSEARSVPPERPVAARRPVVALAVLATWLCASFAVAEAVPRLLGFRTWRYFTNERTEPRLHEADAELGWVNKPGHYVLPPHVDGGREIEVTFLPDGSRSTGGASGGDRDRLVFLGCSVTAGYGLSDVDTFAYKVQQTHPELRVVNFGTAAYGTFQSMLRMERVLAESPPPRLVLYGFITKHESRNVATYDWLRGLVQHSRRGHVAPPYVTLGADRALVRHPPESFAVWPLADRLVTARMAGDAYMHLVTYGREAQGPEATKRLMLEMTRVARQRATPFAVLFLLAQDGKKDEYVDYFRKNDIPYVDCVEPFTDDNRIPGEGHPNEKLNSIWAQCISQKFPELLGDGGAIHKIGEMR